MRGLFGLALIIFEKTDMMEMALIHLVGSVDCSHDPSACNYAKLFKGSPVKVSITHRSSRITHQNSRSLSRG